MTLLAESCRPCRLGSRGTMDELLERYGKDLRIVYKHFIVHPQVASTPAYAACAAHAQGKFFEMEDALWERAYKAGRDFTLPTWKPSRETWASTRGDSSPT